MRSLKHELFQEESKKYLMKIIDEDNTGIDRANCEFVDHKFPVIAISRMERFYDLTGRLTSKFSEKDIKVMFRGQGKEYGYKQLPRFFRSITDILTSTGQLNINARDLVNLGISLSNINSVNIEMLFNVYREIVKDLIKLPRSTRTHASRSRVYSGPSTISHPLANEAIFTHYQNKTIMLDIVDNLLVALWFSIVDVTNSIRQKKTLLFPYMHQRDGQWKTEYSYIFVFGVNAPFKVDRGVYEGEIHRLINIKEAVEGFAIRPFVQHGYAFADRRFHDLNININNYKEMSQHFDYSKYLLCVFKIPRNLIYEYLFTYDHSDVSDSEIRINDVISHEDIEYPYFSQNDNIPGFPRLQIPPVFDYLNFFPENDPLREFIKNNSIVDQQYFGTDLEHLIYPITEIDIILEEFDNLSQSLAKILEFSTLVQGNVQVTQKVLGLIFGTNFDT